MIKLTLEKVKSLEIKDQLKGQTFRKFLTLFSATMLAQKIYRTYYLHINVWWFEVVEYVLYFRVQLWLC